MLGILFAQATVETVIKVSSSKPKETKEERDAKEAGAKAAEEAAATAASEKKDTQKTSHLPWGFGGQTQTAKDKAIEVCLSKA